MLELMLFVVMSLLQHHILDLHKSDLGASLILIKLHAYILYSLPGLRDDDMLKSIYTPPPVSAYQEVYPIGTSLHRPALQM